MADVRDGKARRRCILEASRRLFGTFGAGKTTIADIAREAGIGVGTVYLEFDSKEAIVSELSQGMHAGVLAAMREASSTRAPLALEFVALLEARARAFLACKRDGDRACELVHCSAEAVRAEHHRFLEQERALLEGLFTAARDSGELGPGDPALYAELVQRAMSTLSPPGIFAVPHEQALEQTHRMAMLLVTGLARRG